MNEKTRDFIKNNIAYLTVALVCLAYIATAFIRIDETGKSVGSIIADGALSFALGIFINKMLDMQGIQLGDRDPRLISTMKIHSEIVTRISPRIEYLDGWCTKKNNEALRITRIKILASAGLKYDDYFEEGLPKPYTFKTGTTRAEKSLYKKQYRAYRKALKPHLSMLSAGMLTSEGGRIDDVNYLGMTVAEYETQSGLKDVVGKIAIAMIFGVYGVEMLADFSPELLIWRIFQVCCFIAMGVIKLMRSFYFMVNDYRARIIKKIDNLQKFENDTYGGENSVNV